MKVVKKCDGMSEHNVLDESTDYYLCGERQGMHPYLLAKKDYEPVEEGKDVTDLYNADEAMGALHSSIFKLTRHEVSKLNKQMKAYAYLLERKKA